MMNNKTFSLKKTDVDRNWVVIDMKDATLGRVATVIAGRLTGKYKPTFTPSMDDGDHVVVINASHIKTTGDKDIQKIYYKKGQRPGSMKETSLKAMKEKDATEVVKLAVYGMIPSNKLRSERMGRLRVFLDENHGHEAQKPVKVEVKN